MSRPTHSKVVTREPHRTHTKDFLKLMDQVQRNKGWREEQTLTHWLTVSCRALLGTAHIAACRLDLYEKNEAEYMEQVRRCRHRQETMQAMGEALGMIVDALEQEPSDVLTPIFSEVAAASSLGQFFTPYDLSLASAQMILQDAPAMLDRMRAEGGHYLSCLEPACGVGGMALAANAVFRSQGIDPAREVHWHCTDLDWRAVCGAYIQLTLTGASAVVMHGNSLSGEVFETLPTLIAVMHPKRKHTAREPEPIVLPSGQVAFGFMKEHAA